MATKKSVFQEEEEKKIKLSIRVPESLLNRISDVQSKLKTLKPSMKFDYEKILLSELETAVNAAEKEIAILEKSKAKNAEESSTSKSEIVQVKAVN